MGINQGRLFSNIFDHVLYPDKFILEIKRLLKPNRYCLLHLSVAPEGKEHPDDDPWSANTLRSSQAVIDLFGEDYKVIEDRLLGQPNWPTYWTLYVQKMKRGNE